MVVPGVLGIRLQPANGRVRRDLPAQGRIPRLATPFPNWGLPSGRGQASTFLMEVVMRTCQMLFGTRRRDGLAYIEPLPSFHQLYKAPKKIAAIFDYIDRIFHLGR